MKKHHYKYILKSDGDKWLIERQTANTLPMEILNYIYSFICNIMQDICYFHIVQLKVPYINSLFEIHIRYDDYFHKYIVNTDELDAVPNNA